jgi:hypothetical protein
LFLHVNAELMYVCNNSALNVFTFSKLLRKRKKATLEIFRFG